MKIRTAVSVCVLAALAGVVKGEDIRIATYNIEHFADHFDTRQLAAWAKKVEKDHPDLKGSPELAKLVTQERNQDNEDNWEVATTLLDPKLSPDILFIQEGCSQEDLEYFNHRWLKDAYGTVKVFPSNTGRDQNVCMMLKPGFEMLETKADYYKEPDSVPKPFLAKAEDMPSDAPAAKENRLFARGPAFLKVKSPGGYVFWVGTNHNKSKYGNSVEVAQWRDREAAREHQIITELSADGTDVVFGGDMNDELGMQEFEQEAGGDSIGKIVGDDGKVVLATKPLVDQNAVSFGGYFNEKYRSFIDHLFVSAGLAGRVKSVSVYNEGLAPVASDHFPVLMVIESK